MSSFRLLFLHSLIDQGCASTRIEPGLQRCSRLSIHSVHSGAHCVHGQGILLRNFSAVSADSSRSGKWPRLRRIVGNPDPPIFGPCVGPASIAVAQVRLEGGDAMTTVFCRQR